jgi:hypothetical protein
VTGGGESELPGWLAEELSSLRKEMSELRLTVAARDNRIAELENQLPRRLQCRRQCADRLNSPSRWLPAGT